MKDVFFISNVDQGGKTYLEYLLPALNSLRDTYNCIVLQTDKTGLSREETEDFLHHPVQQVDVEYIAGLQSQVVLSNDAWVGRVLDESNFGIFISHGNVGMPTKDKYYYSELTSYWDAIICSSRSGFDLLKTGLQLYRHDRKALKTLVTDGIVLRSDLRKISVVPTLPLKIPEFFESARASDKASEQYVVGLLPTQLGICPSGASLYENLQTVINSIKDTIPHATFILRPYMADLANSSVKDLCQQLSQRDWISIDTPGTSSSAFYKLCDTIVTDASTGGVSFMLNTGKLPMYYVPPTAEHNPTVEVWREQMENLLPIAKNSNDLKDIALGFSMLSADNSHHIYKKFYEAQYSQLPRSQDVFKDLIEHRHESRFSQLTLDSFGRETGR